LEILIPSAVSSSLFATVPEQGSPEELLDDDELDELLLDDEELEELLDDEELDELLLELDELDELEELDELLLVVLAAVVVVEEVTLGAPPVEGDPPLPDEPPVDEAPPLPGEPLLDVTPDDPGLPPAPAEVPVDVALSKTMPPLCKLQLAMASDAEQATTSEESVREIMKRTSTASSEPGRTQGSEADVFSG
jgi:hypothetical protein